MKEKGGEKYNNSGVIVAYRIESKIMTLHIIYIYKVHFYFPKSFPNLSLI